MNKAGLGILRFGLHLGSHLSLDRGVNITGHISTAMLPQGLKVGTGCRRFLLDVIIETYAILRSLTATLLGRSTTAMSVFFLPYLAPFFRHCPRFR